MLSFDIECISEHGFPSAERPYDKIIQIACVCKTSGKDVDDFRVIFALNGCSPISGADIRSVNSEADLLRSFEKLIRSYDPDFLLGYNIINFDLKYILERAEFLKLKPYG